MEKQAKIHNNQQTMLDAMKASFEMLNSNKAKELSNLEIAQYVNQFYIGLEKITAEVEFLNGEIDKKES